MSYGFVGNNTSQAIFQIFHYLEKTEINARLRVVTGRL